GARARLARSQCRTRRRAVRGGGGAMARARRLAISGALRVLRAGCPSPPAAQRAPLRRGRCADLDARLLRGQLHLGLPVERRRPLGSLGWCRAERRAGAEWSGRAERLLSDPARSEDPPPVRASSVRRPAAGTRPRPARGLGAGGTLLGTWLAPERVRLPGWPI